MIVCLFRRPASEVGFEGEFWAGDGTFPLIIRTRCSWAASARTSASPTAYEMFVSGDQLLKGAALNAVQIAKYLLK